MFEEALLTGVLEPTNEPYAIAKMADITLCESYNRQYGKDYRSVMPTNLYGSGDNFHPKNTHVLPALISRFHEAVDTNKGEVVIWGTGATRREFLHVNDMAEASLFVMDLDESSYRANGQPMHSHINVGCGEDVTIGELAGIISEIVGFKGKISFDASKPAGTPRKLMNVRRLAEIGWTARTRLREGIAQTYSYFLTNQEIIRQN